MRKGVLSAAIGSDPFATRARGGVAQILLASDLAWFLVDNERSKRIDRNLAAGWRAPLSGASSLLFNGHMGGEIDLGAPRYLFKESAPFWLEVAGHAAEARAA